MVQFFSRSGVTLFGLVFILLMVFIVVQIRLLFNPPESFGQFKQFEVEEGMSVRDIAKAARAEGVVRSDLLLYAIITYSHDPTKVFAGTYVFTEPTSVFGVAQKLADNDIENDLVRLTLPEGMRMADMAAVAETQLPEFDVDDYLRNRFEREGKMFPETYYVPETFTADDLLQLQMQTYEEKIASIEPALASSSLTELEVRTLASIVEREANSETSMRMVAGILLNRLETGMPLQADASIEYVLDVPLNELPPGRLATELREKESPYNTYLNIGLPPTPIGNPGLTAMKAVLNPTPSDYLFYITGNDGNFYYAKTLTEHNRNIETHLR